MRSSKSGSSSRVPRICPLEPRAWWAARRLAGPALLRDPWPHDEFSFDGTLAFYGGDDGGISRTRINDTIVVNRGIPRDDSKIVKPSNLTVGQIGSALPITVSVSDPSVTAACGPVAGLESALVLSVTDITVGPDKGKPIGDSENIFVKLNANGLTWVSVANQYRTNLDLTTPLFAGALILTVCASSDSPARLPTGRAAAGEVCTDVIVKGKK